jgi:MFS family permease
MLTSTPVRARAGATDSTPRDRRRDRARALGLVSLAAVLANASWFSATAVVPALRRQWELTSAGAAWLVIAVQLGFVVGSIATAMLNLPDRVEPRRLIAVAAATAGVANLGLLAAHGLAVALPVRFLVGVALAGVYSPALKLVATHFARGRGMATGVVVGALTLGSGTPNLVRGLGDLPWQATIVVTSGLAFVAALVIGPVRTGPGATGAPPLDIGAAARALVRQRPLGLVMWGYLGHMWELYALWTWLAAFFVAARGAAAGAPPSAAETGTIAFLAIGVAGLLGSVVAGRLADRVGRTAITSGAMVLSAGCCLVSPLAFAATTPVLVAVLMIWGATVIADSAQFSAAVTELAEPRYAGSVLALQLALGFVVTMVSIRVVPLAAEVAGWRFAMLPLAPGPLLGAAAMLRLRTNPAARRLANGRR